MKNIVALLFAILLQSVTALAIEPENHWSVGLNYDFTIGNTRRYEDIDNFPKFKGVDLTVGYRHYIDRWFFVQPEALLYYESHGLAVYKAIEEQVPGESTDEHSIAYGLGLAPKFGVTLYSGKVSFDLYAGPTARYALHMHQHYRGHYITNDVFKYGEIKRKYFLLYGTFGGSFNIWRMSVKVTASFCLSNYATSTIWGTRKGAMFISTGLGYRF